MTKAKALHDLLVDCEPDRVVIEICSIAGWVSDLVRGLEIELEVASTNDERWHWRRVKQKNNRRDALKLAQLSARHELSLVHVPQTEVRQWRALIAYRQHLVQRRTKIRNRMRELLVREGQLLPRHRSAWTQAGLAALAAMSKPLEEVAMNELWGGELALELAQNEAVQLQIGELVAKLDALGAANHQVRCCKAPVALVPVWPKRWWRCSMTRGAFAGRAR